MDSLRLQQDELESLYALTIAARELQDAERCMAKRLDALPHGRELINTLKSSLDELLAGLMETVPEQKRPGVERSRKHLHWIIRLYPFVTKPKNETVITSEILDTLVEHAHDGNCIGCGKDCNKCQLGKVLDGVMVQTRDREESWSWIDINKDYNEREAALNGGFDND